LEAQQGLCMISCVVLPSSPYRLFVSPSKGSPTADRRAKEARDDEIKADRHSLLRGHRREGSSRWRDSIQIAIPCFAGTDAKDARSGTLPTK